MEKHTSLPWILKKQSNGGYSIGFLDATKADADVTDTKNDSVFISKADAQFIINACNLHYELIKALKFYAVNWKRETKVIYGNPLYNGGDFKEFHYLDPAYPNSELMSDYGNIARSVLIKADKKS